MSDNIFNQPSSTNEGTPGESKPGDVHTDAAIADLLNSIKNERGEPKYKDLATAIASLKHTQTEFLPTLLQEKRQLEEEVARLRENGTKLTELEKTVMALTQKSNEPAPTSQPSMTEEQIADLVNSTLSKKQQEDFMRNNISSVTSKLKSQFGEKAEEVFYNKAKEMGLTNEEFNSLAAKTPKAVLSLLGVADTGKAPVSTPSSGFNTDAFQPTKDSFVTRNPKQTLIGATSQDLREESRNAAEMVKELHEKGLDTYYLTDPKNYFKYFGK